MRAAAARQRHGGRCPLAAVNQIEIYFSILQRKVLSPAAATSLAELATRILAFEATMRDRPRPIDWQFTSVDFDRCRTDIADVLQLAA